MPLRYTCIEDWPPLAWLAKCPPVESSAGGDGDRVEVYHGPRVETRSEWFCEAVWDGDYEAGRFDQTDIVFGSGGRLEDEGVTFVSSGTMVDRLHSISRDFTWVSNSLACLMAAVDAEVDGGHLDYRNDFNTVTLGLDRYKPDLATSAGPVRLTYHRNLRWEGGRLYAVDKPNPNRDFSSYARYRAFLDETMGRLVKNMESSARQRPYRMLGTLSSGYDSPAVVALAKPHGLREAVSVTSSKYGGDDSGEPLAGPLGVELTLIDRDAWGRGQADEFPEVPFLASNAQGQDLFLRGAEPMLAGRVLLTGTNGDNVWDRDSEHFGPEMSRKDMSGSSLAEYRLWAGFIHCPVSYLGARQARDVLKISRSEEMAPWDVGGGYSRPICRRIVEELGVPREAFGVEKKAGTIMLNRIGKNGSLLCPSSLRDYHEWLRANASDWPSSRWLRPRTRARVLAPFQQFARSIGFRLNRVPRMPQFIRHNARRLIRFGNHSPLFPHLFPWAIERAKKRYQTESFDFSRGNSHSPAARHKAH